MANGKNPAVVHTRMTKEAEQEAPPRAPLIATASNAYNSDAGGVRVLDLGRRRCSYSLSSTAAAVAAAAAVVLASIGSLSVDVTSITEVLHFLSFIFGN